MEAEEPAVDSLYISDLPRVMAGQKASNETNILQLLSSELEQAVTAHAELVEKVKRAILALQKLQTLEDNGEVPKAIKVKTKISLPASCADFDLQIQRATLEYEKKVTACLLEARTFHLGELQTALDRSTETFMESQTPFLREVMADDAGQDNALRAARELQVSFCLRTQQAEIRSRAKDFKDKAKHAAAAKARDDAKDNALDNPQPLIKEFITSEIKKAVKSFRQPASKSRKTGKSTGKAQTGKAKQKQQLKQKQQQKQKQQLQQKQRKQNQRKRKAGHNKP